MAGLLVDPEIFYQQLIQFFRFSALAGFLATTALLINLNKVVFNKIFQEKAKSYFWFFLLLSLIPLLAFIYVFNILFGRLA